jgi:3-dehydroquinate dehydratase I
VSARICVSILPKNIVDTLNLISKAEKTGADFIEVRMDTLEEMRNLSDITNSTETPLIATNKLLSEKGFFAGTETERQNTLLKAARAGFEFIDVDYFSAKRAETIAKLKQFGTKTIVSYHKFDGILNAFAMERILNEQIDSGADVCKIILTAKNIEDNLPILSFVNFASQKAKLVCFCMGEAGKTSRLLSPIFGAYFTFACIDKESKTAPGQMSIKEMKDAYKLLGIGQQ